MAEYLEEVRHHILDNLDPFKEREGEEEQPPSEGGPGPRPPSGPTAIPSASTA